MADTAHIVHHIPGRVRLRVPARRHNQAFFSDTKQRLEQCEAISSVTVNPATASVLVRYSGELTDLLAQVASTGLEDLLEISDELPPVPAVSDQLLVKLNRMDSRIASGTGGGLDGRSAVLITLLLAGTAQLLRGQVFGPAVPLIWYAAQAIGGILPRPDHGRPPGS
jgi:hypothetical protein